MPPPGSDRALLDTFFHLYALERADVAYILDTFPVVKKNEEKAHGEYRTRRLILEAYDAMAAATKSGAAYVSPLGPPTLHSPRVAEVSWTPAVVPVCPPYRPLEAEVCLIYALLHAEGGATTRSKLAAAFDLHTHPAQVTDYLPARLATAGEAWVRQPPPPFEHTFKAVVETLSERHAVRETLDSAGASTIEVTESSAPESGLHPWWPFEARLLLAALANRPVAVIETSSGAAEVVDSARRHS